MSDSHQKESFLRKYVFSVDHKWIGIQYAVTALVFLFFGFCLMLVMRWQLAYPGEVVPIIGKFLSEEGILTPDLYNSFGAMHGTIMIFLGVVPLAVGGFGNFVLPLQIGAPDMAFPKINMASYWASSGYCFIRMDNVSAAFCHSIYRRNHVAFRNDLPDHIFTSWFDQFYCHRHPVESQRSHMDASPVFCVGTICNSIPSFACLPSVRSSGSPSIDGPLS